MPPAADRNQKHWVYRLFDSRGILLYVGMTVRPSARFSGWRRSRNDWFAEVVRVDWRQYPNYELAKAAETTAIRAECPRHNKLHNHVRHLEVVA